MDRCGIAWPGKFRFGKAGTECTGMFSMVGTGLVRQAGTGKSKRYPERRGLTGYCPAGHGKAGLSRRNNTEDQWLVFSSPDYQRPQAAMTNSDWLAKTRSLYGSLKAREREYMKVRVDLPFTLEAFRSWLELRRQPDTAPGLWTCYLCRKLFHIGSVSIDHVTPLAHAGRTTLDNLKPCCKSCNRAKGAMSLSGYRELRDTVNKLHPKEQRYFWTRWSAGSRARWTEAKRADNRKAREILKRVSKAEQR